MAAMSVNLRHGRRSGITEGAAPLHPTRTDPRNKALLVQNSGTVRVTSQVFCFLCALFSPYRLFSGSVHPKRGHYAEPAPETNCRRCIA
jgi:hypothetical protein